LVDQLNHLIDKIFKICDDISNTTSNCSVHLSRFQQQISGNLQENFIDEIDQVLSDFHIFIDSTNLNGKQKKELANILERIKSGVDKLLVSILIVSLILLSFLSSRMK
jgi:uncharacterized protein (DUF2344 family)